MGLISFRVQVSRFSQELENLFLSGTWNLEHKTWNLELFN